MPIRWWTSWLSTCLAICKVLCSNPTVALFPSTILWNFPSTYGADSFYTWMFSFSSSLVNICKYYPLADVCLNIAKVIPWRCLLIRGFKVGGAEMACASSSDSSSNLGGALYVVVLQKGYKYICTREISYQDLSVVDVLFEDVLDQENNA